MSTELANARTALSQASAKGVGRSLKKARLEKVTVAETPYYNNLLIIYRGGSPLGSKSFQQSSFWYLTLRFCLIRRSHSGALVNFHRTTRVSRRGRNIKDQLGRDEIPRYPSF